ncbi:MAG TPA: L-threonylcarbamoyladenylate synthase [Candidatus Acidoferrales bacterium]|nr:L-threonylcarbamoyladenylate synthase [Candidatus Acidoferrales bacterium]
MSLEILKISRDQPEPHVLIYAAGFIARGDVVAIPTDTLYGLAADPFNLAAVEKIFRIKGRAETKALPILLNSPDQVRILAREVPDVFFRLAKAFWPGALTLIVDASDRLPLKVTGNTGRIALRWPKCPAACELIARVGSPVTGTSANLSGFPPCSSAAQVAKQLGHLLSLLLDGGDTGAALPSTIVDVQMDEWRVVREGGIAEAELLRALAE